MEALEQSLSNYAKHGGSLSIEDGNLVAVYPKGTPPEVLTALKAHRTELLERLTSTLPPAGEVKQDTSLPLLTGNQLRGLNRWLDLIEEHDPGERGLVLQQCETDPEARRYYLGRARAELPREPTIQDDRRRCGDCRHLGDDTLHARWFCQLAKAGRLEGIARRYQPDPARLWRCDGWQAVTV